MSKRIKAHALYFAILIGVLVALLLTALFLVADFYGQQQGLVSLKNRNLHHLKSVEAMAKASEAMVFSGFLFDDSLNKVQFVKRPWGAFETITCEAVLKRDTLRSSFLCGATSRSKLALSVQDFGHALRVSGKSRVVGRAILPKRKTKTTTINGTTYLEKSFVKGTIETQKSPPKLQVLTDRCQEVIAYFETLPSSPNSNAEMATWSNSFANPPIVLNRIDGRVALQGNFIIRGGRITVPADAQIEDVIIYADNIVVASGFRGKAQFWANSSIEIQEDVELSYPSVVALVSDQGEGSISCGTKSLVEGVVVGFSLDKERSVTTTIQGGAIINGELLSNRDVQLEGTINGRLFCRKLIYDNGSIFYDQTIYNGVVDLSKQLEGFVGLFGTEKKWLKTLK